MKITTPTKTWRGTQVPGEMNGHTVCTATHPNMPNLSGKSRGRKIHLMKTEKLTFCNMLVHELAPTDFENFSMTRNGTCKVCIANAK